jgi:hypothetical protein
MTPCNECTLYLMYMKKTNECVKWEGRVYIHYNHVYFHGMN